MPYSFNPLTGQLDYFNNTPDTDDVNLTGNQTIAGVKSFSSAPQSTVDPTNPNDLTRLSYVTSAIAAAGGGASSNFLIDGGMASTIYTNNSFKIDFGASQ